MWIPITGPTATTTAANIEEAEEEGSPPLEAYPRAGERCANIPCTSPCPCPCPDADADERALPGGLANTLRRVSVMQLNLYPDGIITPPSPAIPPSPGPCADASPSPGPDRWLGE